MVRRGTKQNPFTPGEVVFVKRLNRRGIVSEARTQRIELRLERSYAPIRYTVRLLDSNEEIQCSARDLEEVKTWNALTEQWEGRKERKEDVR